MISVPSQSLNRKRASLILTSPAKRRALEKIEPKRMDLQQLSPQRIVQATASPIKHIDPAHERVTRSGKKALSAILQLHPINTLFSSSRNHYN